MGAFDRDLAPVDVITTNVVNGTLLANVATFAEDSPDPGENDAGSPIHGAIGVLTRVLDADSDGAAEVIGARGADGLAIMAGRDLRIEHAAGEAPKGTARLCGYHGARVSIEVSAPSTSTVYVRDGNLEIPGDDVVQGNPLTAKDVALADPLVEVLTATYAALVAAVAALATLGQTVDISQLTTKIAPYLVPGSPSAPTTRAPGLRGEPGA